MKQKRSLLLERSLFKNTEANHHDSSIKRRQSKINEINQNLIVTDKK